MVKDDKFNLSQCPKNDLEKEFMKTIPFSSAIRILINAQVCTRPEIALQ